MGKRRWQVGERCDEHSPLQAHDNLKLLKSFNSQQEWVLEPGDILYLPPAYAHWGIGLDNQCMTYSVGFRAPSYSEILSHYCDAQLAKCGDLQRYRDKTLVQQQNPGEINLTTVEQIQAILKDFTDDKAAIAEWFGCYMTEPKYPHLHEEAPIEHIKEEIINDIENSRALYRNPATRFAYTEQASEVVLYVDGKSLSCKDNEEQLAKYLCQHKEILLEDLSKEHKESSLLITLIRQGALYFEAD